MPVDHLVDVRLQKVENCISKEDLFIGLARSLNGGGPGGATHGSSQCQSPVPSRQEQSWVAFWRALAPIGVEGR